MSPSLQGLPSRADVVVVGAGAIGAAAAWYLTEEKGLAPESVAESLWSDYVRPGRHGDKPPRWLAPHLPERSRQPQEKGASTLPARQARHALPAR